jgi:cytochrome c peroxidase
VPKMRNKFVAQVGPTVLLLWMLLAQAGSPDSAGLRLGLPPLPADARADSDPGAISLGKRLFFDKRLSEDGNVSCANCHVPEAAFTDGRALSTGHGGSTGTRNAPSLLNVAYADSLFWDGRAADLETQALAPLTNSVEHALHSEAEIIGKIRADPTYVRDFTHVFNVTSDQLEARQVTGALAAYERTLIAGGSAFDRYLYGGYRTALTPAAVRGLELFRGRAQCTVCHKIEASSALFTDRAFHMTPLGLPPSVNTSLGKLTNEVVRTVRQGQRREVEKLLATDPNFAALGRFVVTLDPQDIGKFKTPSLRNVALTAPYMHDGSIKTLEEAIDIELYGRASSQNIPITLTRSERDELLEFLRSLTSRQPPTDP